MKATPTPVRSASLTALALAAGAATLPPLALCIEAQTILENQRTHNRYSCHENNRKVCKGLLLLAEQGERVLLPGHVLAEGSVRNLKIDDITAIVLANLDFEDQALEAYEKANPAPVLLSLDTAPRLW